ncbi:MAG TPA: AraC family transcriptional regulator [Devosia sp.]|jgi:AraC-like DNA-binding protein|uniref:helix-turn-helix domain-containing protein n=1 Tax=Devosia sp. TaxID=1871048 RepID=UPI002F9266BF
MFHPNMQSTVEGFFPHGMPSWRSWGGMLADVWEVTGASGARGEYVSPHARLFVVLDETRPCSIQLTLDPRNESTGQGRLSYIPPGVKTWSFVGEDVHLRHLDLHLDLQHFATRLNMPLDPRAAETPRLMFSNERISALAALLAADCAGPGLHQLYGESLATAIFVELFQLPPPRSETRGQLSPRRLRLATQFLANHCRETVLLQDLAALVGLSPSYFNAAFKASTGLTPHQWQMRSRINWVKDRLIEQNASLSAIANAAGFADQAHMTRVFKRSSGQTPAAWLRSKQL